MARRGCVRALEIVAATPASGRKTRLERLRDAPEALLAAVAIAKRLRRANPVTGRRRSLRKISAELAAAGHLSESGKPYSAKSVRAMVGGRVGALEVPAGDRRHSANSRDTAAFMVGQQNSRVQSLRILKSGLARRLGSPVLGQISRSRLTIFSNGRISPGAIQFPDRKHPRSPRLTRSVVLNSAVLRFVREATRQLEPSAVIFHCHPWPIIDQLFHCYILPTAPPFRAYLGIRPRGVVSGTNLPGLPAAPRGAQKCPFHRAFHSPRLPGTPRAISRKRGSCIAQLPGHPGSRKSCAKPDKR